MPAWCVSSILSDTRLGSLNSWLRAAADEFFQSTQRQEIVMLTRNIRLGLVCVAASMAIAPAAQAQWAVIDMPAIVQLVQEVQTMQQQLTVARNELQSTQKTLQAMTGNRGMSGLLGGTNRNYLPANWTQVTGALQGNS